MTSTATASPSPLRFRIWDNRRRAYWKRWTPEPGQPPMSGTLDEFVLTVDGALAETNWLAIRYIGESTDLVVEQWTGVNDADGRQVFEGDIVRVNGRLSLIERRAGYWGRTWSDYHLGTIDFAGGEPRVVGNRWEHPTLLEEALSPVSPVSPASEENKTP